MAAAAAAAAATAASWLHHHPGSGSNGSNGSTRMRLTEGLLSLLKEPHRSTQHHLPDLLDNYRQHGAVNTQGSSAVGGLVGFSNAKLSSSKTKFEGVCLLSVLIKDSSSEVFQQHCLSWLRSLQQIIQSQAPLQTMELAVSALQDLLQYAAQIAELCREVGLNSILGILTSLLGLKTECELAAMEGMTACMTYFPKACGSLRDKLGAFFLSKMNSTDHKIQEVACECYGRLPSLGGAVDRGGGRAEGWTNQIHCLLASANGILAQLYQGSESEGTVQYDGPGVELPFPPLDDCDPLLFIQLHHRYRAVCYALKYTLSLDPKAALRLPVRQVLNLVCRALAVTAKSINSTGDGVFRLLVLPGVHKNTLEVLCALITAVQSAMVPYATVLQKLFSQTLSAWTPVPETNLGQQRAFCSVRVQVYQTILLWVRVGGASAGVLQGSPTHSELLLGHLLGDITPGVDSVKLRPAPTEIPRSKPGPRSRKPLLLIDSSSSLQKKGDLVANQDTCLAALKALRHIILTSGTLLKDDVHKRLQDVVVPLCVRLQQQLTNHSMTLDAPGVSGQYASALPRRELYRLLLSLVLVPSPRWPPPLTCTVSVLSQGRRDRSLKVSSFCTEGLVVCNALLHPRTPSLSLPLPPLALKPTPGLLPSSSSSQGGLTLPTLLGAPGTPFPARGHGLGALGPAALLGSLENHLSLGAPPQDLLLSSHHQDASSTGPLGPPEGQRPVFVRYDKEEPEDVEISLDSDSDDSVVIVPPGMLSIMDPQQEDPSITTTPTGGATGTPLPGGVDSSSVTPGATPTAVVDGVASLANDLPSGSALLAAASVNSFPGPSSSSSAAAAGASSSSLASLIPPLGSGALAGAGGAPPGGLGVESAGPQLQQMLMQSSSSSSSGGPGGAAQAPPGGPMAALGPLQMHPQQLHNQLSQTPGGRQLHPHQPPAPHAPPPAASSNEDSGVININSSDEEEEEEDMEEEEDELGEEEEEEDEEGLEDEEEEEEGSDFPEEEEEFYDGEEYDYDEEEGEELEGEEEEEEEGEIPSSLESRRRRPGPRLLEEGEVLGVEGGGAEMGGAFGSDGGEAGHAGGIEEIPPPPSRPPFGDEDGVRLTEVESIGVLEEAQQRSEECRRGGREEEEEEEEEEEDPTMPQILCVTGGALEESQEAAVVEQHGGLEEEPGSSWEQGGGGHEETQGVSEEEEPAALIQQEQGAVEPELEEVSPEGAGEGGGATPDQEKEDTPPQADPPAPPHTESSASTSQEQQQEHTEVKESEESSGDGKQQEAQQQQPKGSGASGEETGGGEDNKGMKRKREEATEEKEEEEGQGTEKKKMDDEVMASMLADFIACPPDDEDGASGSKRS